MLNDKTKIDYEKIAENLYGGGNNLVLPSQNTANEVSPDPSADHNHKAEVLATRKGGFGSSDAKMIIDIAKIGKIYRKEHLKRLAVFEGLIEPDDITTPAMEVGNQREREIFNWLNKNKQDIACPVF